ncbi:T9SS type A sorting domain-containing protein [Bacteroidota bacterium]
MKKLFLSIITMSVIATAVHSQTFSPTKAQGFDNGTKNESYTQTVSITNGATTTLILLNELGLPSAITPFLAQIVNGLGSEYTLNVTSVVYTAQNLPAGLTSNTATVSSGGSGTLTISGKPTETGTFTVDLTTEIFGKVDISPIVNFVNGLPGGGIALLVAGISSPYTIPQPISGRLDEGPFSLIVDEATGIAKNNELFSLDLYPNPTDGIASLNVNSAKSGMVRIEVYAITGAMIQSRSEVVKTGANRINLNLESAPAGIYLVKAIVNGKEALKRLQVK